MSRIAITVNGQHLLGNTHQPVLEQLELAGLKPEFQCRNGVCGACRCTLKKGAVSESDAMAYLAYGEILACQSIPNENLTLEFNYRLCSSSENSVN